MIEAMERVTLGEQAKDAWNQHVAPAIDVLRADYMAKLVEMASRPQDDRSTQGIRNLSIAIRVTEQVEAQMRAVIAEGEAAKRDMTRGAELANMSAEARRYASY